MLHAGSWSLARRSRTCRRLFHVRDAHGDMLEVLRERRRSELPAGRAALLTAAAWRARGNTSIMGFYLSFAGPVTFKNAAHVCRRRPASCPADRLLVETDSPYLAPVPMRGQRNEPTYVQYVAGKLAELRDETLKTLARAATENTCRLYGIAL